ncbi:MAG: hypothetical protein WCO63_01325 [Bacteroidota bacterium]
MSNFLESTFVKNLVDKGEGPTIPVNTSVSFDSKSVTNLVIGIFVAGFLVVLTWYAFKKLK